MSKDQGILAMEQNRRKIHITRREFLNSMLAALSVPAVFWWLYVGRRDNKLKASGSRVFIGKEIPTGISFVGSAVVINNGGNPVAFTAKCTHLGCRITEAVGDELVCQCHGSRFDTDGHPVKGPAKKDLHEMKIILEKSGYYLVHSQ